MVKPKSRQSNIKKSNDTDIAALADKLADKPYGEKMGNDKAAPIASTQEEIERISISLPKEMRYLLEDIVMERKRAKEGSRSISAIVRDALEDYFKKIGKV